MAKAKKFGAFAGVFTPSILTILGVIMYMRLGWVVGQAGLINTIIIILLAHVISLSTGLSVSSIATDKRIKAGGIYYILSRSLGLPMGGSIGITLFIGTALSISLYLVGFAENFLSIEVVRDFLGLEENKFGYQVIGTGAILILVIIAFISTSLAIKTQYYILGAIALSLVSILVGFLINTEYHPDQMLVDPAPMAIPMELIFAVFFPAVTGFTAGVAMSGDLKDPKKSIPFGTMTAIITGLFVYLLLAIGIAFFVNRELLLNDINYLMKVAWFSPLVIAGIWGATLSSALGGILGGPRILQAMSADRISPRIFARGYGINNEPRNALLLIFLIAEAGILIGELNVIAGIVSMFYLASYGFINLAYYLESWASADFRPSFKINRLIGLIGFIAAFGVMFRLDMISMFAALIIMSGIYFFLKRKQLKLDFGDVWQSVWSSLMRTALDKMDKADEVERNWQPNIILFSGGTKKRPHLISLGKSLVGRHGVLSNFDLIENKSAKVLFPKRKQAIPGEDPAKGVFTRRQTVQNVYEGIEMISRTYGFSGLEPNTVMLGWSRQSRDPLRFAELLKTLYDLDLNVLLLGYDKRVGYGKKQTIDIWLRDKSNHGNLALTLSKLLVLSPDWQTARIRLLIVNYLNAQSETLYRNMEEILDNMRIDAELKVINNQIEQRPFYDIVEFESAHTDLVFLEIPGIKAGKESKFVEDTARLLEKIGTVMLIEASSSFKSLKIGMEKIPENGEERILPDLPREENLPEIALPDNPVLHEELSRLTKSLQSITSTLERNAFSPLLNYRADKISGIRKATDKAFGVMEEKLKAMEGAEKHQLITQLKTGLLIRIGRGIDDQIKRIPAEKEDHLLTETKHFLKSLNELVQNIPTRILIRYYESDLQPVSGDPFSAGIRFI
jgi:amino acid transporter